ncbi:MAG: hypothetical protein JW797_13635 [Bradymonadales bacterium]|nr:hypothetical protein [Bradymonadales bacterium]
MAIDPRNARYKELILGAPYAICIERARYVTQSYRRTEGRHPALRAALAFAHCCRNVTVAILDEERIAGNRTSKLVGCLLPVERGEINLVMELELDALTRRERQPYHIDPEDRRELLTEILPYWKGKTLRHRKNQLWKRHGLFFRPGLSPSSLVARARSLDLRRIQELTASPSRNPRYLIRGLTELLYNNIALVMNAFDTQGHLILGHRTVLGEGFVGVKERARQRLERAHREGDREAQAFLEGVLISCEAIRGLAGRFADLAARMAKNETDPVRREELVAMAERCRRVPYHPPTDFREAVQALWLTQVGGLLSYGQAAIFAVGRVDQTLYPYYQADRAAGCITPEEATAWIEELLLKLGSNLMVLPYLGKHTGNELGSDSCSPTIGGLTPQGESAVNELTHLWLDAYENVRATGNSFMIRLSKHNPPSYWRRVFDTFRVTSGAALFNDEVIVDALQRCGVTLEHARDYGLIGCVEPTGDGDTFGCTSGNDISFAAAMEMVMTRGRLRIMGRRIGPKTVDPCRIQTFEELLDAFEQQVVWMVETVATAVNLKDQAYQERLPNPFVSSTLVGCIENGRDMTQGSARYNFASISARGLGTAVDSLAAIEHHVFATRQLSMKELVGMLDTNFAGQEVWRQRLKNRSPVYGCDQPRADAIARRLVATFCALVSKQRSLRGGPFRPSFFSYGMHVFEGMLLGATPNGRKAGEPISNSFSPSNGSEREGPTAMLKSVASFDHRQITNGCALNVKLLPTFFATDSGRDKIMALVQTFFDAGGMEIQPNVVSDETLRAAQRNPEQYRDLVVRVSGYSAYFCDLGKPLQDEIISRVQLGAC